MYSLTIVWLYIEWHNGVFYFNVLENFFIRFTIIVKTILLGLQYFFRNAEVLIIFFYRLYTGLAYILPTVRIYFVNNALRNPYRHNIMIVMHIIAMAMSFIRYSQRCTLKFHEKKNIINARHTKNKTST